MTLLERIKADSAAFKLFNHTFESEMLQFILNKATALYPDNLYDYQLTNIVQNHIRDNFEALEELTFNTDYEIQQMQILFRECNLLCDYVKPLSMKRNKEVGRY